ncbi:MAG TPA: UMP kinase [Elusimicrobia bacterium]|nr:MAG: UMP kinase [Elusimicrobia bacterium RIFOXYA12_FULL_49_49]OGS11233.1 MAG: UMP kinase [Elusimicrobia bacterium RIFOXYB1_FULL_48_9]OGS15630.1 MAG: UMP kinase [Elusimicrobia bacterium RIFOXYA2_FULL_47_53]OGS26814.1 MAG: UMP kinase [Elusimicrobia bacterium RIFOXYB12_FULL_50_12]OGS30729.1 MAG: UMP kinase [Elusimicrobia bacterium RIFOXYB2_FULL_46_23]HBU68926.1 UMP kinase [Elusimicrobiota bacterium]
MAKKRVLLKLSGEALGGQGGFGINLPSIQKVVAEIKKALKKNIELAIVVGGGNIWRGAGKGIERVTADYMGMLATTINALALKDAFERNGIKARVQSAIPVSKIAEAYTRDATLSSLKKGTVVVFAGGTGNPYFTTDTTSALRAAEINADLLLKATQVDGVYSEDPKLNPKATKYDRISYEEAIQKKLKIMDTSAFALCKDNNIPIVVFDFHKPGNLAKALSGGNIGTIVG